MKIQARKILRLMALSARKGCNQVLKANLRPRVNHGQYDQLWSLLLHHITLGHTYMVTPGPPGYMFTPVYVVTVGQICSPLHWSISLVSMVTPGPHVHIGHPCGLYDATWPQLVTPSPHNHTWSPIHLVKLSYMDTHPWSSIW